MRHTFRLQRDIFTARKRSLRRLCFYTCLSVILFTEGEYLGRYTPSRYTPQAGTPPGTGTPPGRYTPWAGTPPQDQVPPEQCMLGDTGNKQAVRILLECILVGICFSFILNALMVYSHWPELRQGLEPRINGLYETF